MIFNATDCKLKLWKKVEMPERKRNTQGVFEKTGSTTEMTGYVIHDQFGSELYIISADSKYREFDGKDGLLVQLEISYDDYGRKNKIKLVYIGLPSKK